jgi:hypothetical protein
VRHCSPSGIEGVKADRRSSQTFFVRSASDHFLRLPYSHFLPELVIYRFPIAGHVASRAQQPSQAWGRMQFSKPPGKGRSSGSDRLAHLLSQDRSQLCLASVSLFNFRYTGV